MLKKLLLLIACVIMSWSIMLPEELEEIKPDAFNKCAALTKVTFPTTLRTLGSTAFASSGLRTLYLPEGLEKMTDTNGDKVTDVADVNRTIDSILKLNNQTHHKDDVNRDDVIDIVDLNEIINEILGL